MTAVETTRLYLRRLQPTDLDDYYQRIYADADVMRALPPRGPISREAFEARVPTVMVAHWETHGFGPWVVIHKADQQLIGHCGLRYWPNTADVEVLYALDKRYWGKGLATEGASASLRYGFEQLCLERIIAAAAVDNQASRRVLEKIGLQYEKNFRFGELDVAGYVVTRADYTPGEAPYRLVQADYQG
jgi:RimJ/RimL family protein N-acetyltransferase